MSFPHTLRLVLVVVWAPMTRLYEATLEYLPLTCALTGREIASRPLRAILTGHPEGGEVAP